MKTILMILTAVVWLAAAPMFAAYDAFLKIDGVQGESTDVAHRGWIDALSFSWGVAPPVGALQRASSSFRCASHDFRIVKPLDKSSPKLAELGTTRARIPNLTLDIGGERHLLQNVQVKSVQQTSMGDGSVRQAIEFTFERCATHETAAASGDILKVEHKTGFLKNAAWPSKWTSNGMFNLGGGSQGPIILQDLRLAGPNQAIIAVREDGAGLLLPAVRRALQSKQRLAQLVLSAYPMSSAEFDKDHKSLSQMFTFRDVAIVSITQAGGFDQITLNFSKFDGPMAGFHTAFPK